MTYRIDYSSKFLKDAKKMEQRGMNMLELKSTIQLLKQTGTLPYITPKKYNPHKLIGSYENHWEAHIKPDWLLIWLIDEEKKVITLVRTGTHADLF